MTVRASECQGDSLPRSLWGSFRQVPDDGLTMFDRFRQVVKPLLALGPYALSEARSDALTGFCQVPDARYKALLYSARESRPDGGSV